MQLNKQSPSASTRQVGSAIVTLMICLIVGGAWATQSSQATDPGIKPLYDVLLTTKLYGGSAHNLKIITHADEQFVIKEGEADDQWEESFVLHPKADNTFVLESTVKHKSDTVGHPSVLFHSGQPATISMAAESGKYELTVDAHAASVSSDTKAESKSGN